MTPTVAVDARMHDAVIFGLPAVLADPGANTRVAMLDSTVRLVRALRRSDVGAALVGSQPGCGQLLHSGAADGLFEVVIESGRTEPDPAVFIEAARRLGARPERVAVIDSSAAGLAAARRAGIGLVIGFDRAASGQQLRDCGADLVVDDVSEIQVPNGFRAISTIPNALESYGQLTGVIRFRSPIVFVDFDGTIAPAVSGTAAATPVRGIADALTRLAAHCPVAVVSERDLDDLRGRIDVPGLWYAASCGLELMAPDGTRHTDEAAASAVPRIERAAGQLRAQLAHLPAVVVQPRRFAVAVHHGNAPPECIGTVVSSVRRVARWEGLRVAVGRNRLELCPDIAGDSATAVARVRDRAGTARDLLPIYLGDDLTDEAAFDAVGLDGIGILVKNDERGDRRSAAGFALDGPEQVCRFLARGANWLDYERAASGDAWTLAYHGYDPHDEKLREALCTVGNGYFATRGAAPESKAGQVHYPGSYAAGLYNRLADDVSGVRVENESLVNLPNWLPLTFRVNGGNWFDIDTVAILDYRQVLDIRNAVLTREVRFRDDAGHTTALTQRRFVAMHMRHAGALETTIVAEDWSGTLEIRSMIDGGVRNSLVERYRDLSNAHLAAVQTRALTDNSVLLSARTSQSQVPIALAARTVLWRNGAEVPAEYRFVDHKTSVGHDIAVEVSVGDVVTAEKIVALFSGRDVATSEPGTDAALWIDRLERFGALQEKHQAAWAQLWQRMSIELDGHDDELRVIRLHLLHLLQTVSLHSADIDAGIPARGLHGEAYRGLIFWDELFIFPVLNFRFPMITRALLRYRYRRLPEARQIAREAGYAGAMFPWQSGSSGREECQRMHLNPRSGRWNPDASALAHHIGLAVAYNVWQFYQATADLAYLIDYGAAMLAEIARFWVSRAVYDRERDRYLIRGVIGPDEFHSGYPDKPHQGIDNNAYTNVMAVWVILRALDTLALLPMPNRLDLLERLGIDAAELNRWRTVSRRMFIPFHDGLISQFEGYEKLAELDWTAYRQRYGDIHRLDRILEAEHDDINGYKAAKQADVLMLFYLLSSDELGEVLAHLGYRLDPDQIPRIVDYYIARTSHGSTLSAVVHSWVLARANRERALDFFQHVLSSDVNDVQGGTTTEGIHTAAMAGSVDLVQRCFTGLEFRRDRIVLAPCWPEQLGPLGFPIHYRGLHLYLRVSGRGAEVSVEPRDAPPVQIEYRGQVRTLMPGSTIRFT